MHDSFIQTLFAERIGGRQYGKSTAIYKFEKIKRAKRAALAANPGAEILDLGVGEPDEMAFAEVVEKLHDEARQPENRGYADNGGPVLKKVPARTLPSLGRARSAWSRSAHGMKTPVALARQVVDCVRACVPEPQRARSGGRQDLGKDRSGLERPAGLRAGGSGHLSERREQAVAHRVCRTNSRHGGTPSPWPPPGRRNDAPRMSQAQNF